MAVSLGLLVCTLTCKKEMFIKKGGREERESEVGGRREGVKWEGGERE